MNLWNRIGRMTALLMAGILLLPAGNGICVSAKENTGALELFLLEGENCEERDFPYGMMPETVMTAENADLEEILNTEETGPDKAWTVQEDIPGGIGVSVSGEVTETFSDLRSPLPDDRSGDDGLFSGTVPGEMSVDISIDNVEIAEDPSGSVNLPEISDIWNETDLHIAGLASDTSGGVFVTGQISAAAQAAAYDTCYGNQLTGESRKIYDEMKKKWEDERGTGEIVYTLSRPVQITMRGPFNEKNPELQAALNKIVYDVAGAADAFLYDYPDVFWTYGTGLKQNVSYSSYGGSTIVKIDKVIIYCGKEYYSGARKDVKRFYSAVDRACEKIQSCLSAGSSREDVVKAIHDYVCSRVTYDREFASPYAHTAAGFFLYPERKVVCEGYAKSFKILCDRFGIECALIVGEVRGPHMWNYVRMEDGAWYLVDTTWDDQDQIGEIMDTYFLAGSGTIGYDGISVSRERVIHKKFSDNANAKEFKLPVLNAQKYTRKESSKTTGITVKAKTGTIKNKKLTLKKGKSETLVVTLIPVTSGDEVSFSSSNSKIVKVNRRGKLVGKKAGKAKITVRAGKKKTVITVTVK